MTLLVDIGNSRVKWARLAGGALGPQQAAAHAGWSVADWRDRLLADGPVDSVFAASVAGEEVGSRLGRAVRDLTGGDVRWATARRTAAGVTSGYSDPALLGVDRWLAIIGAYRWTQAACVVADIGTAATVDVVDDAGRHRGGFIVPGPALMVTSLVSGTSDLGTRRANSRPGPAACFANNTRDAMERGGRLAVAALIDRSVAEAAALAGAGGTARALPLLLTGGAAAEVAPWLRSQAESVPDLVLRGLAALVADEGR